MSLYKNNPNGGMDEVENFSATESGRSVNMTKVAKWSKVPLEQFIEDFKNINDVEDITEEGIEILTKIWNEIKLPQRSTPGSAGYDIYTPYGFGLMRGENILLPTGIRCEFDPDYAMIILPRSGLGTKKRLMLANTVPLIDSDYYKADNFGHIMLKLCFDGIEKPKQVKLKIKENLKNISLYIKNIFTGTGKTGQTGTSARDCFIVEQNDRIVQAVFVKIGFAEEDGTINQERNNGLGSTGN